MHLSNTKRVSLFLALPVYRVAERLNVAGRTYGKWQRSASVLQNPVHVENTRSVLGNPQQGVTGGQTDSSHS